MRRYTEHVIIIYREDCRVFRYTVNTGKRETLWCPNLYVPIHYKARRSLTIKYIIFLLNMYVKHLSIIYTLYSSIQHG